jgi:hypothetical protein
MPLNRPPDIDFLREVAVLAWPVRGQAPEAVLRAPGLVLRVAGVQRDGIQLEFAPSSGGPAPATPVAAGDVAPYALVTVRRDQWPLPAPPPTIPPLLVTLARA